MKTKMKKRIMGWGMCMAMMLCACGCGSGESEDLMKGISARPAESLAERADTGEVYNTGGGNAGAAVAGELDQDRMEQGAAAVTDFGVRLLQNTMTEDENVLISPLSVILALGMTANGAGGETLSQMEEVFGISKEELNTFLRDYRGALPRGDKYKLSLANALWLTADERFNAEKDFLQTNADYYEAGVYRAAFDDAALKEINDWVEKNTDGMVKNILDRIDEGAVMYLVNALAFDAEWQETYEDFQVREGAFTREDKSVTKAELMYSGESLYLEDEQADGFLKYYADGKYAFAALLPHEGVSIQEYVDSLTGEELRKMLTRPREVNVQAAIPRFQSEYSVDLKEVLQEMGMREAFDENSADFLALGYSDEGNVYISRVVHKTFIAMDTKGTRAGAATVVEMRDGGELIEPEETKTVYLNRPFVYMLIDCETKLPVFLGTVVDVGEIP
ncbi:MAG: serpin family protein [Acetatifactor sp.]|nr:serpin family protein [Acetatifactor sp.]